MKLSCLQENLTRGLDVVGRAVPTRSTLPITQNVLLATEGGMLKLSATNLEIGITTWVGAMIEEEGAITVPARLLREFIGSLPPGTIEIDGTERPKGLSLKSGRFNARISGTEAEDFPPIPSLSSDEGTAVQIDNRDIRRAISQTAFAAATEEARPVLTGVKVDIEGDELTLAAADGFRLAVHKGKVKEPVSDPVSVIVPARTLNELSRFLGDQEGVLQVLVASSKPQVLFKLDNIQMVSQVIQGNFPPYADLLADAMKDTKARAVVSLSDMLMVSRSVSIFARESGETIKIQITPGADEGPGQLTISSRAEEVGENTGEVDGEVKGEEAKIAFNSKFLLDVLSAMGPDKVCIETSGPSRAGVFKAPDSEQYLHLVMPMFINW